MNVNCIVTMGLVPEIKYLVSCILYLVSMFNNFLYVYGPCVCNKDILLLLLYKSK